MLRSKPGEKLISRLEVLQTHQLPAQLVFEVQPHAERPRLAATNTRAALATLVGKNLSLSWTKRNEARQDMERLWQQLASLMTQIGNPMRSSKQLYLIRAALQAVSNIVLKNDEKARAQMEGYMETLYRLKEEGKQNFSRTLNLYFAQIPDKREGLAPATPGVEILGHDRRASVSDR